MSNPNSNLDIRQGEDDVVVIGGGIGGLTAAIYLARKGRSVTVLEQSSEVGGRARTAIVDGYYFNQGPHALYLSGASAKILREIGIKYSGNAPPTPAYAVKQGKKYPLPSSLPSLITTKLLKGFRSRIEAIRFFAALNKINFAEIEDITLQEWLNKEIRHTDVSDLLKMLCRVATYTNDPEVQSAGAALSQLQMAISGGVIYLDGGWQTLVNGLVAVAQDAKVRIVKGKRVVDVVEQGDSSNSRSLASSWRIHLSDGTRVSASILIIAGSPRDAYELFRYNKPNILSYIINAEQKPVRAACLDIALSTLPNRNAPVAFGIDSPLYLSVHSASAILAPKGGALIHLLKYLSPSIESNPIKDESDLEYLLDVVQPGWRTLVVRRRFLPNMIVSNALVTAEQGGTPGRPDTRVPNTDNLYIVGDWVGPEGLLADASFSSAKRAAQQILNTHPYDRSKLFPVVG
jgi:phytoene dehydrogenase-like protein